MAAPKATPTAKQARLIANRARAKGEPVPAEIEILAGKPDASKGKDLDDPKAQREIEFPETIPLVLFLSEHGERACSIATQFSYEQVNELGIFEDLQSFSILVRRELAEFECRKGDEQTYMAALTTGRVRAAVRRLLSKITVYDEPWDSRTEKGEIVRHVRPTTEELYDGIRAANGVPDPFSMYRLASLLFSLHTREVEHQKNARKAAVPG